MDGDSRLDGVRRRQLLHRTSVVTQKTLKESEQGVGESGRAAKVLDKAFPTSETPAGEMILVQTRSGRLATADLNAVAA